MQEELKFCDHSSYTDENAVISYECINLTSLYIRFQNLIITYIVK